MKIILYFRNLLIVFAEAAKLDIDDINYSISSDKLNLRAFGMNSLPRKGIFIRLLSLLKRFAKSYRTISTDKTIDKNCILFFANNNNELHALEPVYTKIANSYVVGFGSYYDRFPYFITYIVSLLFLPTVFCQYLKADENNKEKYRYAFDSYVLSYGFYVIFRCWIQKNKPLSIVISNDLIFTNRALIVAAKESQIITFYIQHASINNRFPPLTVDYALLDGNVAVTSYSECGSSSSTAFIIGVPKLDSLHCNKNVNPNLSTLGICTNDLDSFARIESLCRTIKNSHPSLTVILRSHPADRRLIDLKKLALSLKILFSDARSEFSLDFLRSVDAIVACDSNVLLEAAMMDVYPITYDFSLFNLDWYGFVKNGLTEYFSEPEALCERLVELQKSKPSIRAKSKLYSGTVGTKYDGNSSKLAAMLIADIDSTMFSETKWRKVVGLSFNVFELADNA